MLIQGKPLAYSIEKVLLTLCKKVHSDEEQYKPCGDCVMAYDYANSTILLALSGLWVALVLACAWIPAYPVLGTPAVITFSSIVLSALTAPLLGPLWGTVSGFVFGWLVQYVNPSTSIGLLTFLSPTLAALMSGLVLFNKWKEATLILASQIGIWLSHPFAWYQLMPIIMWQYGLVLILIVVPPIRKWIIRSITTRNPASLTGALWCLAWIARIGGDVVTGNNIAVWVLNWGVPEMYAFWAPMTIYYAIADSLNCIVGATLGTLVLLALRKANMRILAVDLLESKKRS
jgi:hypothetical protein